MTRTLRPLLAAFVLSMFGRAEALDPNAFTSLGTFNPGSTVTVNTDTLAMSGGASFTGVTSGNIAVFTFASVTLGSGISVNVSGSRCFALLSRGSMSINGTINLSASGSSGGACGGAGNMVTAGGPGAGPGAGGGNDQGAGGAGFGGNGGGTSSGAPAGVAYGNLATQLQGGSGGGKSTWVSSGSNGGGGGGGLELAAIGTLDVLGSAQLRANGAAGVTASNDDGGGGGSGGGLYLHAGTVNLSSGAQLLAQGGNGGNGGPNGVGGGGGGGGRIRAENVVVNSATVNVAGGAATSGGFGTGQAGAAGVSQILQVSPEIAVSGNGTNIVDGDPSPSSSDHTDFGSQAVSSGSIVRTFTIANSGNANLTISGVSITGTHAADFSVTTAPASPVAASASTTFQVTFNPSASGARNATVTINNNDGDEGAFDFAILGTGTDPEIAVSGNGTNIVDGDASPSGSDHTDFGSQSVSSGSVVRTFTITNSGNANLTISGVSITGTHAPDFSVTTAPASPVAGSGSTTFQVTFNPSASGARNATVTINNNDGDEGAFDFAILGTGTDPEIAVSGNGANIVDGDPSPSSSDHTDFGSQSVSSGNVVRTFTVANTGNASLTLGALTLGGAHAGDFSISATPTSPVAGPGNTSFQISFNPSANGLRSATLSLVNGDTDENPFDFAIQGTGVDPDIAMYNGNSTAPADERADGIGLAQFADTNLHGPATAQSFTIRNAGSAPLTGLALSLAGAQAADYAFGSLATTALAPGETTVFTVTFLPTAVGQRDASLAIASNDADENPFDIALRGIGRSADLQISKSNQDSGLLPGRDTVYVVQVLNAGPGPVGSAQIADDLPTALANPQWTCTSDPAGLCPSNSGNGDLLHTTGALPAGALIEYQIVATPTGAPPAFITNTATVSNGDGSDPALGNNSASDTDPVVTEGVFADDFETGAMLLRTPLRP